MHGLSELETELVVHFSTGSTIRYKYKRADDGTVTIRRALIVDGQVVSEVDTTTAALRADSARLSAVAQHFEGLASLSVG